jgi:hypothetical protein
MNCELECTIGREWPWPSGISLKGLSKTMKISVKTAGDLPENRIGTFERKSIALQLFYPTQCNGEIRVVCFL